MSSVFRFGVEHDPTTYRFYNRIVQMKMIASRCLHNEMAENM